MYCTNCGDKLDEGANFCTKCGTKVNDEENTIILPPVDNKVSSSNNDEPSIQDKIKGHNYAVTSVVCVGCAILAHIFSDKLPALYVCSPLLWIAAIFFYVLSKIKNPKDHVGRAVGFVFDVFLGLIVAGICILIFIMITCTDNCN